MLLQLNKSIIFYAECGKRTRREQTGGAGILKHQGEDNMNILVINCGSSSLKFQVINPETEDLLAKGLCERIGIDGSITYEAVAKGLPKV